MEDPKVGAKVLAKVLQGPPIPRHFAPNLEDPEDPGGPKIWGKKILAKVLQGPPKFGGPGGPWRTQELGQESPRQSPPGSSDFAPKLEDPEDLGGPLEDPFCPKVG